MSTIAQQVQKILEIKADIKDKVNKHAIKDSTTITTSTRFDQYANKIDGLPTIKNFIIARQHCRGLFQSCDKIKDFSNWIRPEYTENIKDFRHMFDSCAVMIRAPQLNISNFYSYETTMFGYMFYNCTDLEQIDSGLNTIRCTDFTGMFYGCKAVYNGDNLLTFNNSNTLTDNYDEGDEVLNTSNGTIFNSMFMQCTNLTKLTKLNTSRGSSFKQMFYSCTKLETLTIDLTNATDCTSMFNSCSLLKNVSFKSFNISISLSPCKNLSQESILRLCYEMHDNSSDLNATAKTLTLNKTFKIDELAGLDIVVDNEAKTLVIYNPAIHNEAQKRSLGEYLSYKKWGLAV